MDIAVESGCAMVQKMAAEITRLGRRDALIGILNNPVYLAAGRHLKHAACPVPAAVLKALEVEAGLNVNEGRDDRLREGGVSRLGPCCGD